MLYIDHATLLTPGGRLDDAALVIRNGFISRMGSSGSLTGPLDTPYVDAAGMFVAPGFIDLQVNGAFGDDFTAHPETIWRVAEQLPRFGVTSFLPTLVTCDLAQTARAQDVLRERPAHFRGAEPLGLHLEGPFLNPQKKGAHNPAYLREPDSARVPHWSRENGVWLVTLAPELPNAPGLVGELAARGVLVSLGHTMASVDQAKAGFRAGIRYATHLFNAMSPLDHRAPGAAGAVLATPEWVTGLIADGVHVDPALVKVVWLAKHENLNLVSDAMGALGMPPGSYRLNDFEVVVSDRDARLANGTLAGSILPLDRAVRNLIEYTGCTLREALQTVTTTPARVLEIAEERGRIAEGMVADLVFLDERFHVRMTIAKGEVVYSV